jgi:hypothetical protein
MQIADTMSDDNTSSTVELSAEALASVSGGRASDRLSRAKATRAKKRARRRYSDYGIGMHSMNLGWRLGGGS